MEKTIRYRWANPETILVATNLRDTAHLMPHAIAQAKLSGARLILVHFIEPSYLRKNPQEGLPFVLPGPGLQAVQERLAGIVKWCQVSGVLCEPITLKGSPVEQIKALLKTQQIDRVLVGTKSDGVIGRLLIGSVAEDLLHSIDVPVCVLGPHVPQTIRNGDKPSSVVFAASLQGGAESSAKLAIELASLYESRLTLLHVIPGQAKSEEGRLRRRQQCEEELRGLISDEASLWCSIVIKVREGDPAEEILAEAKAFAADLIILGAKGASKGSRLLAEGVLHRVIAASGIPVLSIRQTPAMIETNTFSSLTLLRKDLSTIS
jgi:nucleotide-binding universal stress UspA family protein